MTAATNSKESFDVYRHCHRYRHGRERFAVEGRHQAARLRRATTRQPSTWAPRSSHSGICLTVTGLPEEGSNDRWFEVEAWEEALRLTTVANWQPGTHINLERSLKIGDELGGHIVSGHVDGKAEILSVTAEGDATRFRLRAPAHLAMFVAPKGSIALDGTSLTVNCGRRHRFRRAVDPSHARSHDLGRTQGWRLRQFRSRYDGPLCR